ncbi:hydroxymethylbilane synthase, partial [Pseudomonas aeruginosa]
EGAADIAVNSMKDVKKDFRDGFRLVTIREIDDPRDASVSMTIAILEQLPAGSVVRPYRLRLQTQMLKRRSVLRISLRRGIC